MPLAGKQRHKTIKVSLTFLQRRLAEVLNHRYCVQAWLGYGNPLFLGFGEDVLPPIQRGRNAPPLRKQRQAKYRFKSLMSDWWLDNENGNIGWSEDDESTSDAAIAQIVGRRVIGWRIIEEIVGININFEGGLTLRIKPYPESEFPDAWGVRTPDRYLCIMRRDRKIYRIHAKTPSP